MSLPRDLRDRLRRQLWDEADELRWMRLSSRDKSGHYDDWVVREDIGGQLSRHMDPREIRVYLKDSVLKPYAAQRMESEERPFRVLGLAPDVSVVDVYTKPHGRRLSDGRIICWGPAANWKAILMALHERAFSAGLLPYAAVLHSAQGRFMSTDTRAIVDAAAERLGIERVIWLED
ncbi:MAG: hypothetical protein JXA57_08050 [Armatimonadetes bacterium]|nr:hypothetical protein [Armatimonadota bacterium]